MRKNSFPASIPSAHTDVTSPTDTQTLSHALPHTYVHCRISTCTLAHVHSHTHSPAQHILSQSASHSQAKQPTGSEAVNLPHADMYLWMAYTQLSC